MQSNDEQDDRDIVMPDEWESEAPEPWERQAGESSQAFDAFCAYRDLGSKRSLTKTSAANPDISLVMMRKWSVEWHWVDRVLSWEDEQDRVRREAQLKEIADMSARHVRIALTLQNKMTQRLVGDDANRILPIDLNKISAGDLLRMLESGINLERMARGVADKKGRSEEGDGPMDDKIYLGGFDPSVV